MPTSCADLFDVSLFMRAITQVEIPHSRAFCSRTRIEYAADPGRSDPVPREVDVEQRLQSRFTSFTSTV